MRHFMTITPWIVVRTRGETLEVRITTRPVKLGASYSDACRTARISSQGYSFDRALLGLTSLSLMANLMDESAEERAKEIQAPQGLWTSYARTPYVEGTVE